MTRAAILLTLLLSGCESPRFVNPDCPAQLTIQSGEFGGFCDRRKTDV